MNNSQEDFEQGVIDLTRIDYALEVDEKGEVTQSYYTPEGGLLFTEEVIKDAYNISTGDTIVIEDSDGEEEDEMIENDSLGDTYQAEHLNFGGKENPFNISEQDREWFEECKIRAHRS